MNELTDYYQLYKEGADEANHAGPGVPDLGGLGEAQEGLAQPWLHPGHFNLNGFDYSRVETKTLWINQSLACSFIIRSTLARVIMSHDSPLEEALQLSQSEPRL